MSTVMWLRGFSVLEKNALIYSLRAMLPIVGCNSPLQIVIDSLAHFFFFEFELPGSGATALC
jgi:hypothetical protein